MSLQGANSWAYISPGEPGLHHQLPKIHSQTIKKIKFIVGSTTMVIKMPGWKRMEIRKLKTWALDPQAIALLGLATGQTQSCHTGNRRKQQRLCDVSQTNTGMHRKIGWVERHLTNWNGRCLISQKPSLVMETDASTTG